MGRAQAREPLCATIVSEVISAVTEEHVVMTSWGGRKSDLLLKWKESAFLQVLIIAFVKQSLACSGLSFFLGCRDNSVTY